MSERKTLRVPALCYFNVIWQLLTMLYKWVHKIITSPLTQHNPPPQKKPILDKSDVKILNWFF